MSDSPDSPMNRAATAYANAIVRNPLAVLLMVLAIFGSSLWMTSRLTINSNQLELIDQNLPEVQEVKRVIDMVGGAGHLLMGLRSDDEATLKKVADDLAAQMKADSANVRTLTYKIPVDFVQKNMVLFIRTEDLLEGKRRIMEWYADARKRANPFFIEFKKTEPVKLELQDLVDRYSSVGKKSIKDDFYISNDRKMVLLIVKPMWDSNKLDLTARYLQKLQADLAAYSANNPHGVTLVERYREKPGAPLVGSGKEITYGFTGGYKTSVDDRDAIEKSLPTVTSIAFVAVAALILLFFRKVVPVLIVKLGIVLGTVIMYGFAYLTLHELNMVTSILGAVMLGVGIDFGIHFTYRTRLELGQGRPYDEAIRQAIINAGRPAFVSAIVVGGSFFVMMVSSFKGFSHFGWLAGWGTLITGLVAFMWTPAALMLLGNWRPHLVEKLVGRMQLQTHDASGAEPRFPAPKLTLAISTVVMVVVSAFALPWTQEERPKDPTLWERLRTGITFNYNTRALVPEDHSSIVMQDEIGERFKMSADPIAYYTRTREEAKLLWDEMAAGPTGNPRPKYGAVDQVVSLYTFVPPPDRAGPNAKVLAQWKAELDEMGFDPKALPPEYQDKAQLFLDILGVQPFGVDGVPDIYAKQFTHLPSTRPENHGWLTFVYPAVDLWDGKKMLEFVEQTKVITIGERTFRAAGQPILYGTLAKIVLADGQLMVLVTALWILGMHWLDFRKPVLALASVIPLGVGLVMTLGFYNLVGGRLNFMNLIVLPILLGAGVSHGLYLLHRFLEGTSPVVALRSVGAAVAASTLTTVAGFAALIAAEHKGLKSIGVLSVIGLIATLLVSFTVLAAVLQLMHDARKAEQAAQGSGGKAESGKEAA
ncbi:MAG: MMPL family transporter [Deltaproteobacteria bacterium]|nr:MMPL family transporter [Deltaproteobacteria bacterium]